MSFVNCFLVLLFILIGFVGAQPAGNQTSTSTTTDLTTSTTTVAGVPATSTNTTVADFIGASLVSPINNVSLPNAKEPGNFRPVPTIFRCQSTSGHFLPSATNCEDRLLSGSCEESFPPYKNGNAMNERPSLCENPALYEEALECAKTCKLCCERKGADIPETRAAHRAIDKAPPPPVASFNTSASTSKRRGESGKVAETDLNNAVGENATLVAEKHVENVVNLPNIISDTDEVGEPIPEITTGCQDDPVFIMECRYLKGQCTADEFWVVSLVRLCPQTCGICDNLARSRQNNSTAAPACVDRHLRCPDVKREFCDDPENGELFRRRCPRACGRCLSQLGSNNRTENECRDQASDCTTNAQECSNPLYKQLMERICRQTCKFCGPNTDEAAETTGPEAGSKPSAGGCEDKSRACTAWKNRGFCVSQFYKENTKVEWCKKTCQLC